MSDKQNIDLTSYLNLFSHIKAQQKKLPTQINKSKKSPRERRESRSFFASLRKLNAQCEKIVSKIYDDYGLNLPTPV